MRSDIKEWKSSAGVCVAAVVSTSFGESEDRVSLEGGLCAPMHGSSGEGLA